MNDKKIKLAGYLLLIGTTTSRTVNSTANNTSLAFLDSLSGKNKSKDKSYDSDTNKPSYKSVFTPKNVLLLTVFLPSILEYSFSLPNQNPLARCQFFEQIVTVR